MVAKKGKKTQIQLVKGMKDRLPSEQVYWDFIFDKVKSIAADNGFARIETPLVEFTQLFKRTVGEDTDIVSKEMYSFVDQGGDRLALRPENTAGVVRSYVEHGMLNQPQPVKMFYFGPQFRHEKPQAGRYRQFWQFGFELIGEDDPVVDAQVINISYQILKEIGLDVEVHINSIGDDDSRARYLKVLTKYYKDNAKQLTAEHKKTLAKNPLRLLDSKDKVCQDLAEDAPQIIDYLSIESNKHFMSVLEYLDELDVKYVLNPRIVRGLDYYNDTAWEIVESDEDGKLNALGGGGRYDGLTELLGGRPTPAIGFAMGVERIINKIKEKKLEIPPKIKPDLYIAQLGVDARKKSFKLFTELRVAGLTLAEDISKRGLKDQLENADKRGVKFALILGQKEIADETVLIRDMESGVQEVVDYKRIKTEIKKRLDNCAMKEMTLRKKREVKK